MWSMSTSLQIEIDENPRARGRRSQRRSTARGRRQGRTAPPGNGGDEPRNSGQAPADRSRKLNHRVNFSVSSAVKIALSEGFPEYEFRFEPRRPAHPHPYLALSRTLGGKGLRAEFRRLRASPNQPILDVGLGLRNVGHANYHGCEASRSPHILAKLRDLMREHQDVTDTGRVRGTRAYTFCRHRAEQCDCLADTMPCGALFNHSIYYNTPAQVAAILLRTASCRGFAVYHKFLGDRGEFKIADVTEATWERADGVIYMRVRGNNHVYAHPPADWLERPFHVVEVAGNDYVLSVKDMPYDSLGVGHRVQLDVFPAEEVELPPEPPAPTDADEVETVPDDIASYLPQKYRSGKYVSKSGVTLVTSGDQSFSFPTEMAAKLRRMMFSKPFNSKTWTQVLSRASSVANPVLYPKTSQRFSTQQLMDAAPYAVVYALLRKLEDTNVLSLPWSPGLVGAWNQHNKVMSGVYPYSTLWLALCGLFSTVWSLFLFMCVGPFRLALWLLLLPMHVRCSNDSHNGIWWSAAAVVFLVVLVFFALSVSDNSDDYSDWDDWKTTYVEARVSERYDGSVRPADPLPTLDTLVNVSEYPLREDARIKQYEDLGDPEPKPAFLAVGAVFNSAVPIVHPNTQRSYMAACRSRVLFSVPEAEPGPWKLHDNFTEDLLPLVRGETGPVPLCLRDDADWKAPTYADWFDRFPKAKQERIKLWDVRYTCGDYDKKHLAYEGFVKREKIVGITSAPFSPLRPRVIQGCSMIEKVATGPWFYQYAKAMKYVWHAKHHIYVSSGATADEMNDWFMYHLDRLGGIDNVVFIGTDFSKFDLTQGEQCKTREHQFYRELGFCDQIPDGENILQAREDIVVYGAASKMEYTFRRQSGTNDTTAGNNRTTGQTMAGSYHALGAKPSEYALATNGDDAFTIMQLQRWNRIGEEKLVNHVEELGFKLKIQVSEHPTDVEFISCRFYPVKGGYAIGKKPGRVLTKIGWMLYKPNRTAQDWESLLKGSLLSYEATGFHVPFLRKYLEVMDERLKHVEAQVDKDDRSLKYRMKGDKCYIVTDDTWAAFERVYGLTEDDEVRFEQMLKEVKSMPYMFSSDAVEAMYVVDTLM